MKIQVNCKEPHLLNFDASTFRFYILSTFAGKTYSAQAAVILTFLLADILLQVIQTKISRLTTILNRGSNRILKSSQISNANTGALWS